MEEEGKMRDGRQSESEMNFVPKRSLSLLPLFIPFSFSSLHSRVSSRLWLPRRTRSLAVVGTILLRGAPSEGTCLIRELD